MKPELTNLLDRLKSDPRIEAFQGLSIFPNGVCMAHHRWGAVRFHDLAALEAYAYSPVAAALQPAPSVPFVPSVVKPSPETLLPNTTSEIPNLNPS